MNRFFPRVIAAFCLFLLLPTFVFSAFAFKDPRRMKIKSFDYDLDVRNVKVLKVYDDHIYSGTPEGFFKYNRKTEEVDFFDYDNGLISRTIFSFTKDPKDDSIWIGTYGGGLVRFDNKDKMKIYNVPDGLCDPFVYDVEFDAKGDMWVATWSGINKISGPIDKRSSWKKFTVESTKKGLSDNWVYAIEIGKKGKIWFGTEKGITLYDGTNWKNWDHKDGMGAKPETVKSDNESVMSPLAGSHHSSQLSDLGSVIGNSSNYNPNYVVAMKMSPDGNLWIGTWGGGLVKFNPEKEKFTNYTVKDGLPGNYILSLEFDSNGQLWVGSNNGLTRYDGKTFTNYTEEDGIFSRFIFSIAFSDEGSLWLGGWGGVSNVLSIED